MAVWTTSARYTGQWPALSARERLSVKARDGRLLVVRFCDGYGRVFIVSLKYVIPKQSDYERSLNRRLNNLIRNVYKPPSFAVYSIVYVLLALATYVEGCDFGG